MAEFMRSTLYGGLGDRRDGRGRRFVLIGVLLCLGLTGSMLGCSSTPDLATLLAAESRSAQDKARDAGRRPVEVIHFFGIEPGMTVVDFIASGGYYTEVLSAAVGPRGKVYAHNIDFVLKMRDGMNEKILSARLAGDRLPNVQRLDREFEDLGLEPESIDVFFTALNLHDIIDGRGPETTAVVLEQIHEALKPDGFLAVVDHAGAPGQDAANKAAHRIEEARAVAALEAAGFEIEATSDILRNPDDDLSANVFTPGVRGHTDRFVLRARKAR